MFQGFKMDSIEKPRLLWGLLAPRLGSALAVSQRCLICGFQTHRLGLWLVYYCISQIFNAMNNETMTSVLS